MENMHTDIRVEKGQISLGSERIKGTFSYFCR